MSLSEKRKQEIKAEEEYRHSLRKKNGKNPALAAVLSFIIPGLGQVYNGQIVKGLLTLFFSWTVIVWIAGIFDAYSVASNGGSRKRNSFSSKKEFSKLGSWMLKGFGVALVLFLVMYVLILLIHR